MYIVTKCHNIDFFVKMIKFNDLKKANDFLYFRPITTVDEVKMNQQSYFAQFKQFRHH